YASCMTVKDSQLYVGGNFTTADATNVTGLAIWDGASWSAPPGLDSLTVPIQCLATCRDTLYFAQSSSFYQVSGNTYSPLGPLSWQTNHYSNSLNVIGDKLYLGYAYSNGGGFLTNGKVYQNGS